MNAGPVPAEGESLRAFLRRGTARAHAALDARSAAFDLAAEGGYGAFLLATAGALLPLEDALDRSGVGGLLPDWPRRARASALLDDLAALGLAPPAPVPPLPAAGPPWAWGTLYVLEGSRLGARLLRRRIPANAPQGATRYLDHGADGGLWSAFLGRLEAARAGPGGALAAALAAFALFQRAFDRARLR
ncbi:MAG: hypothetical protein KDG89_13125 [Geminicoccaceae bacterium]|nr:hypothetical protein [Geminicoccaceae bacterium]